MCVESRKPKLTETGGWSGGESGPAGRGCRLAAVR